MANAYTIDKLDLKTKKALVKDILSGVPDKKIADNYGLAKNCIARYRESKLFKAVAEVWSEQKQDVAQGYEAKFENIATRLNKVLDAIDRELDRRGTGEYDLSNPKRAKAYVKMLNETSKTLQANIKDLARIQGAIKDTISIQNSSTVILNQIGQVIQQTSGSKEEIIARLKQLRRAEEQ